MATAFDRQIQNRNFLSPVGFKFVLGKHPKVDFLSMSANIPDINLATQIQPSYLKDIDVPGEKITYGDFSLSFLVDEGMENYSIIHKWIKRLGFAQSTEDYQKVVTDSDGQRDPKEAFSDGTLQILNSNFQPIVQVKFVDLFPVSLSSLTFDVSEPDIQYFTAEVSFRYTIYELNDMLGKEL
tara:strand:+ start:1541 stop:2086 length:546 start_codon:yes stop_codon:yes gene_type:complete